MKKCSSCRQLLSYAVVSLLSISGTLFMMSYKTELNISSYQSDNTVDRFSLSYRAFAQTSSNNTQRTLTVNSKEIKQPNSTSKLIIHNKPPTHTEVIIASKTPSKPYLSEQEMRYRAAKIRERCLPRRKDSQRITTNQYIATKVGLHKVSYAYYPIAKCGWTTWVYVMFANAGKPEQPASEKFKWGWGSPYGDAKMDKISRISDTQRYKERLLFVRNPWDRLVSAYKNKAVEGPYSLWLHRPCKWLKEDMPTLTFQQFTQCIVDRVTRVQDLSSQTAARLLDIHWTPQYWSALPCETNYTLVGHFDHIGEDMGAAIQILQINATLKHKNKSQTKQEETLAYWYNQLSHNIKVSLQKIYQLDFEIFGFNSTIPG